jgi:hypothetical protein
MERLDLSDLANPYKGISLKAYIFWIGMSTLANHTAASTVVCNLIRAYLALVVWLMLIFISDRSIKHRMMIYLLYLEINPRSKIIENFDYSVIIIKWGMISMSLEHIILHPYMEIAHAVIITHIIVIAAYMPNKIETDKVFNKMISFFIDG